MNICLRGISCALNLSIRNGQDRWIHRWVSPTLREFKRRKDRAIPEKPARRSTFIEWNYTSELYAFGKRLGEEFNEDLLKTALIEKSYLLEEEARHKALGLDPNITIKDNSNLAVDGEKLISTYVTHYFKTTLPNLPKKYRRNLEEHLLSEELLAKVSKGIGIDDIVLSADFPVEKSTLARTLKSVVQALALSKGLDRANTFVRDLIVVQLVDQDLTPFCTPDDPMETLQSLLEEIGAELAEPRLIAESGRNTILANFQVGIYSSRKMIGRGFGESVEIARDMAACDALWRKWEVLPQKRPFSFKLDLPPEIAAGNCQ